VNVVVKAGGGVAAAILYASFFGGFPEGKTEEKHLEPRSFFYEGHQIQAQAAGSALTLHPV
jgi:hypothetical protein